MIIALALDSVRLLLRGRGAVLLLITGLLVGGFVRATRESGSGSMAGVEFPGAALETLVSTLFLLAVVFGLVAGLVLSLEDRHSGLMAELQVRPVRRSSYVAGRLLGLLAVLLLGLLLQTAAAVLLSGLSGSDLPEARRKIRAQQVTIDRRPLPPGELGQIRKGRPGRFHFADGVLSRASLLLRPKIAFGEAAGFSGLLALDLTLELPDGRRITRSPAPFRPLRELPIRFGEVTSGATVAPFVLEVEPQNGSFLLEVDQDSMTTLGARISFPGQAARSLLLLVLAGGISAWLSYLFGLGLSTGPASLAASFVILVALGRGAVLDIVAGIGTKGPAPGEGSGGALLWLRSLLTALTRLVPDLDLFNPAGRLGVGEALTAASISAALVVSLATCLATLLLAILILTMRER